MNRKELLITLFASVLIGFSLLLIIPWEFEYLRSCPTEGACLLIPIIEFYQGPILVNGLPWTSSNFLLNYLGLRWLMLTILSFVGIILVKRVKSGKRSKLLKPKSWHYKWTSHEKKELVVLILFSVLIGFILLMLIPWGIELIHLPPCTGNLCPAPLPYNVRNLIGPFVTRGFPLWLTDQFKLVFASLWIGLSFPSFVGILLIRKVIRGKTR